MSAPGPLVVPVEVQVTGTPSGLLWRLLSSRKVQASLAAGVSVIVLRVAVRFGLPLSEADVTELAREIVGIAIAYVLATAHEDAGRARAGNAPPSG